jgi:hypothetical protein
MIFVNLFFHQHFGMQFKVVLVAIFANIYSKSYAMERTCTKSVDFEFGQWIPGAANCGLLDSYGSSGLRDFANWCWKPYGCNATVFSAKDYCRLVNGKTMLMVGDSLLHNMYIAFYHLLSSEKNLNDMHAQWQWKKYPGKYSGKICNGNAYIVFIRNDHWQIKGENDHFTHNLWKTGLPEADIVFMNKGHHVVSTEVTEKEFFDQTKETIAFLKDYKLTERSGQKQYTHKRTGLLSKHSV